MTCQSLLTGLSPPPLELWVNLSTQAKPSPGALLLEAPASTAQSTGR